MKSRDPGPGEQHFLAQQILLIMLVIAMLLSAALLVTTVWFAWTRFTNNPPAAEIVTDTPIEYHLTELSAMPPLATITTAAVDGLALANDNREPLITPSPFQPSTAASATATTSMAVPSLPPAAGRQIDGEYRIVEGETLQQAAAELGVSVEQLRAVNAMYGDALLPGQRLIVPSGETAEPIPWQYASLDKDQSNANYPLWIDAGRFRLHYMPGTLPAADPQAVAAMMERGIIHVENTFNAPLPGTFDVYVAGTLYEPPNRYLRGRSFSQDRKVFFLHDGSGDAVNQQYLAAHEMTHMYAWNQWGQPFSFLLSEGAAVYTGMKMIEGSGYLPIRAFCAVYQQQGRLPVLFNKNDIEFWRGHSNNLVNYYSGGCLVGYLLETYGVEKFSQVYHTLEFEQVYGKDLEQLEWEWKSSISQDDIPENLDPTRYIAAVDQFVAANGIFYESFSPTQQIFQAYLALDDARLALLAADLDQFDAQMRVFDQLFRP